ncbi:MAG: response regulator transcription factor [Flavobacteriales bacterium]|jgi:two-component system LytT family response regulator|nr:response regulator transcription factor [Flavobacteriales bacterium]
MNTTETRVIIVDDEEGARESLTNLLEQYVPDIRIVAKAENIISAFEKIKKYTPDVVFLDIQMPFGSGFDLLERMGEQINFDIIFVTAFDQYALKAIKYSALDYLLKPVDIDELKNCIKKHRENKMSTTHEGVKNLIDNIANPEGKDKKLAIPDNSGLAFVRLTDIIKCDSDGNYTIFYLTDGRKLMASKTLGDYEHLLEGEGFFRVHRGHLVNLTHIKKYLKGEGGFALMSDGSKVEVARRKKALFLSLLGGVQ